MDNNRDQIVKYVTKRGKVVGLVLAKKFPGMEDMVFVSGSMCNIKHDEFDKHIALAIAEDRAAVMAFEKRKCSVPFSLSSDIDYMANRAKRYFKGIQNIIIPEIKNPFKVVHNS